MTEPSSPLPELSSLLTNSGYEKLAIAAGDESFVKISHVALGDGGGSRYDAEHHNVSLRNERARVAIKSREWLSGNSWLVRADFPPIGDIFEVREIGFFDASNTLIAIWAERDKQIGQSGITTFLLEHVIGFDVVRGGLLIIDAPDFAGGATEEFVNQTTIALASMAQRQFETWEAHRQAHGHYPKGA